MKKLATLFFDMFRIALFVVGGGYAIISVAEEVFSKKRRWLKEGELLDQLALFQMVPGIMAAHSAVYVGRRVAGVTGSLVAVAGVALPSILIFTAVSMGYDAIPLDNRYLVAAFGGLRAALTGVILAMLAKSCRRFAQDVRELCARGARRFGASPLAALIFLKYGLVAFGGGYVLVPLYLQDFVGPDAAYLQIPAEEFANLMALTQMTPGPIGINAATYFGYRLFGVCGALVSTACLIVPGFVILSLALSLLDRFRDRAAVKGLMTVIRVFTIVMMTLAVMSFAKMLDPFGAVLALAAAALVFWNRLGVVKVIAAAALLSVAVAALKR